MSPETLEAFHDELTENYKKLAKDGDIDNLRVLRNKLQTILETNSSKLTKREQRKLEKLGKLLSEIDETIEEIEEATKESVELVDIMAKYKKKNKPINNKIINSLITLTGNKNKAATQKSFQADG